MIKKLVFQWVSITAILMALTYFIYAFLIQDSIFHCSISAIIHQAHHLTITKHLLILGLLPVYIAAIIFGACLLMVFLGSKLKFLLKIKNKFLNFSQ
ncbi:MAG: hypothetical protein A3F11_08930 [Gammaproteobacteria bacterium RIFCSPHIGHO2_12_FULL_37_14]|nr:MAG: hypothetical protein A3F11_08930 [Gammaproteobacteria bacterium RIFCSPHIGHO2_12_FULL_37_14]